MMNMVRSGDVLWALHIGRYICIRNMLVFGVAGGSPGVSRASPGPVGANLIKLACNAVDSSGNERSLCKGA